MKILMVASEAAPYAKTGGLADVLGSLPAALAALGDEVAVVLPKYQSVSAPYARRIWDDLAVQAGVHRYSTAIDEVTLHGVRYLLVDCPALYDRPGGIYGHADDHLRYAILNHAALGIARLIFRPHIVHAHDWQTGLLAPYLRVNFAADPALLGTRCVFTIHNLGYQGNFPASVAADLGIGPTLYNPSGLEFWGQISFMKAGIVWADAVNTVSPTYAREIQTPAYGFGMDGVLRANAAKLNGILNGVDYSLWNPETDPFLPAHFSGADLSGKLACKRALLEEMRLPYNPSRPVIGIVSRFAEQKGFDLLPAIASWLMMRDAALVVLGSGDAHTETMFRALAAAHPDKVAVSIGYNEGLAHRIEAGADMFLMPSRYEPCGLNQIYSLRYGTAPIVRATGGLDDTVDRSTGFKFRDVTPTALQGAIADALSAFPARETWTARTLRGMSRDFSWSASARAYQRLYAVAQAVSLKPRVISAFPPPLTATPR
jgi:starch synthase